MAKPRKPKSTKEDNILALAELSGHTRVEEPTKNRFDDIATRKTRLL